MSTYWENNITGGSWILNTDANYSWFLSPASDFSYFSMRWNVSGYVRNNLVIDGRVALRPALNLKSDIVILSGEGSINDPFIIN